MHGFCRRRLGLRKAGSPGACPVHFVALHRPKQVRVAAADLEPLGVVAYHHQQAVVLAQYMGNGTRVDHRAAVDLPAAALSPQR
jgi:hypothetical protein